MKPAGADDAVVACYVSCGAEYASIATEGGRALCFPVAQVNVVRGASKGVTAIKLHTGDRVLAFELTIRAFEGAAVRTRQGREEVARPSKHLGRRGGKGSVVLKRDRFVSWDPPLQRLDLANQRQTTLPIEEQ
jgi:DNA gyrase/topoisomerase IV subunit A